MRAFLHKCVERAACGKPQQSLGIHMTQQDSFYGHFIEFDAGQMDK